MPRKRETTATLSGLDEVDWLDEQRGFEISRLLRAAGWKHTCETPGSYWLWEKEIEIVRRNLAGETRRKVVALVDRDTAVRLELNLNPPPDDDDDQPEQQPGTEDGGAGE
jgi:hypothetical protein